MGRKTQKDRIIEYIEKFGSISPVEAFRDLGITKLATRVSEMKKEGVQFKITLEKSKNRCGESVYYARYRLRKEVE
jgi:hypothetical protein